MSDKLCKLLVLVLIFVVMFVIIIASTYYLMALSAVDENTKKCCKNKCQKPHVTFC